MHFEEKSELFLLFVTKAVEPSETADDIDPEVDVATTGLEDSRDLAATKHKLAAAELENELAENETPASAEKTLVPLGGDGVPP